MKNIKYNIASLVLILISMVSCDNYFDVNDDPNNPTLEDIDPSLVLPGAMESTGTNLTTRMNQLGNLMAANWGGNVVTFSGPFDDEFRYNVTSSFYENIWDLLMLRTANFSYIINGQTNNDGNYSNHIAVSKIMRAFYFQYLVDLYGDIPYFGKHLATDNITVAYDEDRLVYADLVEELNEAIEMIETASGQEDAIPLDAGSDIIMNGDMDSWIRFANTVKLRVLLRQSLMTDADIQSLISSELSGMTSSDFISANVTMNPGYVNDSGNGRQNPFYATFGFDENGSFANTSNNLVVATNYSIELLDGTANNVVDPRLGRLWTNDGNPNAFQGLDQGQLLSELPSGGSTVLSRLGPGLGVDSPSDQGASMDAYIMTLAEAKFLIAEAIERNYISGNAQAEFEMGIQASFDLLGAGNASSYISQANMVDGLGYVASSNKYQAIAIQKHIALTSINGIEAWIEHTRTGYPDLPLPLTQTSGARPVRLLYPSSELAGNTANVPSQTTDDAFTSKIFWDVN